MIAKTIALSAAAVCLAALAHGASPIADVLAENVLPGDASLTSYTSVLKAVEQADVGADDAWRRLKTREKYDAYRARMRSRMVEAVGGFPARTPLNAQVRGNVVRDGYRVEKVVYESMPGVYVTANLYLPDERKFKPPYPAFLVTCGHSGLGKCDEDYSRVCVMAAHQGLASLIYDPFGQGERMRDLQMPNVEGHNHVGKLAILLGRSTAQFRIWDGIRSMDYLDVRPDIRHDGYGYMGNSGGGTMTSLIMAVDPRVKAAAPSCYLSTVRDVFSHVGPQDAEQNVFGQLAFGLNHASFVLMGGNAVRMHCCHGDFFPFEGSQKTWRTVKETAANCGLYADRYGLTDVPGPHGWKESARTSSVQWMRRWLLGEASALPIDVQACRALDKGYDWRKVDCGLCGDTHKVLSSGDVTKEPGFKSIYEYLRDDLAVAEKRRRKRDVDETARLVAKTAGIRPLDELGAKAKVVSSAKLNGVTVLRVVFELPSGLQIPSVVFRPAVETGSPVIVLGCAKRSDHFARVEKLLASGRAAMVADVIGTGEIGGRKHSFYGAENADEEIAVMLYCLGRSLVGARAEEIVMLADYMKKLTSRTSEVVAHDRTTIPAMHARAVRRDLIGAVELIRPPLSWAETVRKSADCRFANVVNGALLHYDWTDLDEESANPYGACAHITRCEPPARTCAMMRQAGMGWVRADFDWNSIERKRGEWDFSRFDKVVAECETEGMRLLPILGYSVQWANPAHGHLDEWSEYVRRVVTHYGRRLPVVEVWNEENLPGFWKDPNPTNYLALLRRTYETVKVVDPSVRVAFGGTAGVPFEFIEEVYRLGGAKSFDIMSIHPYTHPGGPEGKVDADIEKLRAIMARYGDAWKPIWITEVGWPTHRTGKVECDVLRAGLKVARPAAATWRMIYVPARACDEDDDEVNERTCRQLLDALPKGSRVEPCRSIDLADRLAKGDVDAVAYPFSEDYAADSVDAVHAFVKAGGVLVEFGGMPMWYAYRTDANGMMQPDKKIQPWRDRERLRVAAAAWWTDKRYPKTMPVHPTAAAQGIKEPPKGFNVGRFLTDRLLKPGDEFVPLLSAPTNGIEVVAAAVYRFNSDMKGAIVASGHNIKGTSSEERQAKMTARALGIAFAEGVENFFWYEFRQPDIDRYDPESYFGMVHDNFAPKPAYGAYMTFIDARPAGSVQRGGAWRSEDGTVYFPQWTRPDGRKAGMVWTTRGAHERKLAFTASDMTFLDVAGARVRPERDGDAYLLTLSGAPIYFIGGELNSTP